MAAVVEDVFYVDACVGASDGAQWLLVVVIQVVLKNKIWLATKKSRFECFLTLAATPYSLLAPSVCICDFLLSAITEFLRTSSARIVSARIVMRRVRIGVCALFSSCWAVSFKKRFLKATSSVPICRRGCRAFSRFWMVRRRATRSGPLPESLS